MLGIRIFNYAVLQHYKIYIVIHTFQTNIHRTCTHTSQKYMQAYCLVLWHSKSKLRRDRQSVKRSNCFFCRFSSHEPPLATNCLLMGRFFDDVAACLLCHCLATKDVFFGLFCLVMHTSKVYGDIKQHISLTNVVTYHRLKYYIGITTRALN